MSWHGTDYECLTCGQLRPSPWDAMTHCDPTAYGPADDDNPTVQLSED